MNKSALTSKKSKTSRFSWMMLTGLFVLASLVNASPSAARYFDPNTTTRFLQVDPVPSQNPYPYALNNPFKYTDPLGLQVVPGGMDFGMSQGMSAILNAPPSADSQYILQNQSLLNQDVVGSDQFAQYLNVWLEMASFAGGAEADLAEAATLATGEQCLTGGLKLGGFKSATRWQIQMLQRGWTPQQINEAVSGGQSFPAINNVNPGNTAIRYMHPQTGQSVVIVTITNEVLHVGGRGLACRRTRL